MEIIYFGKPYSFTHVAALKRFGESHRYISNPTITGTIEAVISTANSMAVVPIENTTGGIVYDTVDMLSMQKYTGSSDLVIIEELEFLIRLFLLSRKPIKLSQVKKIYSHEYVLKRSEGWIKKYMPDIEVKQAISTSEAIHKIQKEKFSCAIASSEAAKYYGLIKLKEIIVKGKKNLTRFFVLRKNGISKGRI